MYQELLSELRAMEDGPEVLTDEPMGSHTSFRIGGNADVFITPRSTDQTARVLSAVKRTGLPYFILGNGSNLLVSDSGYRGIVIRLYKNISDVKVEGDTVTAEAGASLSAIAAAARNASLTGFEFAAGIPGTLGGAVVMNAGAYGGEMKDVVEAAEVLTPDGRLISIPGKDLGFGYRKSIIRSSDYVVLSARLRLKKGDREEITALMKDLQQRRISKQPLEFPSAGSTFKRPEGYFAGKLIEDAGLRGFSVGGAMVSDKHCGFVINRGSASASDVYSLICQVKDRVKAQSGVDLEPEVLFLGDF